MTVSPSFAPDPDLVDNMAKLMESRIAFHKMKKAGVKPKQLLFAAAKTEAKRRLLEETAMLEAALIERHKAVVAVIKSRTEAIQKAADLSILERQAKLIHTTAGAQIAAAKQIHENLNAQRSQLKERAEILEHMQQQLRALQLAAKNPPISHEKEWMQLGGQLSVAVGNNVKESI